MLGIARTTLFTGWMLFLLTSSQCQTTKGSTRITVAGYRKILKVKKIICLSQSRHITSCAIAINFFFRLVMFVSFWLKFLLAGC